MKIFMNFALLRDEGLSTNSVVAARAQIAQCERALREFDKHVDAALVDRRLSKPSKRFLEQQWYGEPAGALSLGNRAVQHAGMIAGIVVPLLHAQSERKARQGRFRFRMLTTAP